MSNIIQYAVTLICSIISCVVSVVICTKNNKAEIEKIKAQHSLELKKMQEETKSKIEIIQKETESKIEIMNQEYALKAGTDLVTSIVDKTTDAIYDAPAVKQKINQQANKAFVANKSKKRRK